MESGNQRPLRIVVAAGWLALAWSHLFWDGEGIYTAAAAALPEGLRPEPRTVAGSRIGLAFGAWFFAGGTLALLWRPTWLARAVVALGLLPTLLGVAARAAGTSQPWVTGLAESWLWWAPALLVFPAAPGAGLRGWGTRIGLGMVFGAVAVSLVTAGRFPWEVESEIVGGWQGLLPGKVPWALVLGIAAVASWTALWVRAVSVVGTVGLMCVGICSALVWISLALPQEDGKSAGAMERWHHRAPEVVILLGAAVLPWAVQDSPWRRRLRRVDAAG